jgi:hypothetical protein
LQHVQNVLTHLMCLKCTFDIEPIKLYISQKKIRSGKSSKDEEYWTIERLARWIGICGALLAKKGVGHIWAQELR